MPIYDFNGTTKQEIGKIYDFNGTANSQIGKVYDNNGSANSLIYTGVSPSNPQILVNGVAAQAGVTGAVTVQADGGWWYAKGYTTSQGGSIRLICMGETTHTAIVYFATPIDVTGYSKMCCQIYGEKGYGDATKVPAWLGCGLATALQTDPDKTSWEKSNWSQRSENIGTVTYTISLDKDTELSNVYVAFGYKTTTVGAYSLYIKNIWFEE